MLVSDLGGNAGTQACAVPSAAADRWHPVLSNAAALFSSLVLETIGRSQNERKFFVRDSRKYSAGYFVIPQTAKTPENCVNCGVYKLCRSVGGDTDLSVLDTLVKSRKIIKRGDFLYRTGDPFRAIYAIRGGSVKTYVIADDGRIQVTGFHVAGSVLGLDSIATSQYNCEAIALESTGVCEVPFSRFEELSKKIPDLQYQMLKIMSQEILDNRELMMLLGKMNGEQRLAVYLLSMSRRFGKRGLPFRQFNLSMSRSDIGNYLGMAEETICRIFTRFQEEGLIAVQRRKVTLNDLDRLGAVANRNRLPLPQLRRFDVTDRAMHGESKTKPVGLMGERPKGAIKPRAAQCGSAQAVEFFYPASGEKAGMGVRLRTHLCRR